MGLANALLAEREVGEVAVEDAMWVVDVAMANQVEAGRLAHSRRCYVMAVTRSRDVADRASARATVRW
jgi:hypothetical protein